VNPAGQRTIKEKELIYSGLKDKRAERIDKNPEEKENPKYFREEQEDKV